MLLCPRVSASGDTVVFVALTKEGAVVGGPGKDPFIPVCLSLPSYELCQICVGAGGTSQGCCVEEQGKCSSSAGSGSSWVQLLLVCVASAVTRVMIQVCAAASTVTGMVLVVFSWERVTFLYLWELYAVF